jgi:hypothetical protein
VSRQDYIKIAAILRGYESDPRVDVESYRVLVSAFANMFAASNPLFDRERFLKAVYG